VWNPKKIAVESEWSVRVALQKVSDRAEQRRSSDRGGKAVTPSAWRVSGQNITCSRLCRHTKKQGR